ncbi:MAG TPA: hypothetical protein VG711_01460, partial [Phycisphaerales bacterium]|nr:hypothetical protein [Phycisphaerales bacterium]
MWRRWVILPVFLMAYLAIMVWLGVFLVVLLFAVIEEPARNLRYMFMPGEWGIDVQGYAILFGIGAVFVGSQALFLMPVVRPRGLQKGRAGSLMASMVVAGVISLILTCALGLGILGFAQLISSWAQTNVRPEDALGEWWLPMSIAVCTIGLLSWILWTVLFISFCRKRQGRGVIGRVAGILLGGTIAETMLVLPVDVMIRRKTDCYCGTGTFFSLVLSGWAVLWLAGPGVVVVFMKKRHRRWAETNCEMCGYLRGPSVSPVCPECG